MQYLTHTIAHTIHTNLRNFSCAHTHFLPYACIHRLARYYRLSRKLDANWKYESSTASALVA